MLFHDTLEEFVSAEKGYFVFEKDIDSVVKNLIFQWAEGLKLPSGTVGDDYPREARTFPMRLCDPLLPKDRSYPEGTALVEYRTYSDTFVDKETNSSSDSLHYNEALSKSDAQKDANEMFPLQVIPAVKVGFYPTSHCYPYAFFIDRKGRKVSQVPFSSSRQASKDFPNRLYMCRG